MSGEANLAPLPRLIGTLFSCSILNADYIEMRLKLPYGASFYITYYFYTRKYSDSAESFIFIERRFQKHRFTQKKHSGPGFAFFKFIF